MVSRSRVTQAVGLQKQGKSLPKSGAISGGRRLAASAALSLSTGCTPKKRLRRKTSISSVQLAPCSRPVRERHWLCLASDAKYYRSEITLFDMQTGLSIKTLGHLSDDEESTEIHDGRVCALSVDWQKMIAVSGGSGGILKIWSLRSGKCMHTLTENIAGEDVVFVSAHWTKQLMITASKTLRIWDLDSQTCKRTCIDHTGEFAYLQTHLKYTAVDWSAMRVLSSGEGNLAKLWNIETGECLCTYFHRFTIGCPLALSCDAQVALCGAWIFEKAKPELHTLKLWCLDTGDCLCTFVGHSGLVTGVAVEWSSMRALSGSEDRSMKLWDLRTGECISTMLTGSSEVWSVDVDWVASLAVSGNGNGELKLWNIEICTCLLTCDETSEGIGKVVLSRHS